MPDATFQPVPENAPAARNFVRHYLAASSISDPDPELAVLLVSELATNAIVHVGLTFVVVDPSPPSASVSTTEVPCHRFSVGLTSMAWEDGGLAIVAEPADEWGTEPTATGKRTWFQICS